MCALNSPSTWCKERLHRKNQGYTSEFAAVLLLFESWLEAWMLLSTHRKCRSGRWTYYCAWGQEFEVQGLANFRIYCGALCWLHAGELSEKAHSVPYLKEGAAGRVRTFIHSFNDIERVEDIPSWMVWDFGWYYCHAVMLSDMDLILVMDFDFLLLLATISCLRSGSHFLLK